MFRRGQNGGFLTNEHSGHYGERWTLELRDKFFNQMKKYGIDVKGGKMSNSEKKLTMRNRNGICLLNDGQWVVMSNNKILPLKTSDDFWFAFPILECSPQPTKEKLGDDFPYNELLKHALCSESKYWSSLALQWLELISLDEKIKLKEIL